MTLGSDIAMSWLAETGAPAIALYTPLGVGAPLLDASVAVRRLASRPTGGVRLSPYRAFEPPCDVSRAPQDAARIAASAPVFVDIAVEETAQTAAVLSEIGVRVPDVLHLRGPGAGAGAPCWPGMTRLFAASAPGAGAGSVADDAIWASGPFAERADADTLRAFAAAEIDEFDVLRRLARRGRFRGLRHVKNAARIFLAPASALDAPDERQIAHALSSGAAVFDANGEAALVAPTLGASGWFGFTVEGLDPDAPPPRLRGDVPADWRVEFEAAPGRWRVSVEASARREVEQVEIVAEGAEKARIVDVWLATRRRRGSWEIWDEAEAQLNLEESW